jgi:hypothetical protein
MVLQVPEWNERLLLNICHERKTWAMDLLVGVSSQERMRLTDKETGDSVFHMLAKQDNGDLLYALIGYGFIPVAVDKNKKWLPFCKNKERRLYSYYFEDLVEREYFEKHFLDKWQERLLKGNEQQIRRWKHMIGSSLKQNDSLTEQTIISKLKQDARTETIQIVKRAMNIMDEPVIVALEEFSQYSEENTTRLDQIFQARIEKDEQHSKTEPRTKNSKRI